MDDLARGFPNLRQPSFVYPSEYSLYLPDKGLLQQKLAEWIEEFEGAHAGRY